MGHTLRRISSLLAIFVVLGCPSPPTSGPATPAPAEPPPGDWAESVALMAMALDGSEKMSLRLARFPGRREGTLWMSAFVGGSHYAAAFEGLDLVPFFGVSRSRRTESLLQWARAGRVP